MTLEDHAPVFCSPDEMRTLGGAPTETHDRNLLEIWTLKEAVAKCRGHGLSAEFREWTTWPLPDPGDARIRGVSDIRAVALSPGTPLAIARCAPRGKPNNSKRKAFQHVIDH